MHGDGVISMHGDGVISPGLLWRQIPVENDIARILGGVRYSIQESGGRVLEKTLSPGIVRHDCYGARSWRATRSPGIWRHIS